MEALIREAVLTEGVWTRAQQEACSVTLLGTSGTLSPCGWGSRPQGWRGRLGWDATGPSPASPPRESISVVLGQHFFNRTTDVTQTFGIEKYIPYPLYSVFNPSDHDLGAVPHAAGAAGWDPVLVHPRPEPGEGLGEPSAEWGREGGVPGTVAGQPGVAERPWPSRRKPWTASVSGPCPVGLHPGGTQWPPSVHHGPARPALTSGLLLAQC